MNAMKKALLWALAAITLLLSAAGASAAVTGGAGLTPSLFRDVNAVKKLTLTADKTGYSRYFLALKLRFRNRTRRDFDFGEAYTLEKKIDGLWYTLDRGDDIAFPAIGYYLAAGASLNKTCVVSDENGLYYDFGALEPGRYRVVWRLLDAQTGEACHVAAEFSIEKDSFLYASEPVNFRTGPGTGYPVLRELSLGERVCRIRPSGKWTMVRANGQTGYVYGKYLCREEATAYDYHPAVKLLGSGTVRSIKVYPGTPPDYWNTQTGKGEIRFDSEKLVFITLKKAYSGLGMTIAVYPDEASAKAKFAQIAQEQVYTPDTAYSYFRNDNYIVRWSRGELMELSRRAEAFSSRMEEKLKEFCQDYTR